MHITTKILSAATVILFAATPAFALDPIQIPEPSMLGLLVAGGIVAAIITIRKRRK